MLERLIRSRVDRLGPQPREIITSASVLGREFGLSFLATVAQIEADRGAGLNSESPPGPLPHRRRNDR